MLMVKALLPGAIASLLGSAILVATGVRDGVFDIQHAAVADFQFYWSWPLFLLITALAWLITLMMK